MYHLTAKETDLNSSLAYTTSRFFNHVTQGEVALTLTPVAPIFSKDEDGLC